MSSKERRLAAIVFTDIVGYSAMMQKDERITTKLREKHREAFNRLTKEYGGNVIQYFGDGTLSIYPSATAAVEFAEALQQELRSGQPPVPMRVGIHTGDITYSKEDAYGDGVNVASRIESMCIPGGVFISGKVYDDIKNHSSIKAQYLGAFRLKNIIDDTDIYALSNRGLMVPEYIQREKPKTKKSKRKGKRKRKSSSSGKKKNVAAILALCFGVFGMHRFYLGKRFTGVLFLIAFFIGTFSNVPRLEIFMIGAAILGFIDAVLLFAMSQTDFDRKYNGIDYQEEEDEEILSRGEDAVISQNDFLRNQYEMYFDRGLANFKRYENEEAIDNLVKAAEIRYDDPEIHFMLARCYSMIEQKESGMAHLDAAVAFGLNVDRIEKNDDLAFLRFQSGFDAFVKNKHRLPESNIEEFLEEEAETNPNAIPAPDLLEQLQLLKKLREKGFLTEEEYLLQEQKIKS